MSSWGRFIGKKMMKGRKKFKAVQETNRWNIVTGDKVKVCISCFLLSITIAILVFLKHSMTFRLSKDFNLDKKGWSQLF
jgi:hypothetical protein